jgi:hypothetical protein
MDAIMRGRWFFVCSDYLGWARTILDWLVEVGTFSILRVGSDWLGSLWNDAEGELRTRT